VGRGNIVAPTPRAAKTKANRPASVDNRSTNPPPTPDPATPDEIWLPFPGFEDRYELSSFGRVCSVHSGLIIPQEIDSNGYPCLWIKRPHTRKKLHVCIHLAVATVFLPAPEGLPIVKHKDGDKLNNHASNLEYALTPTTDPIPSTISDHEN
jgi:hypothetical protein